MEAVPVIRLPRFRPLPNVFKVSTLVVCIEVGEFIHLPTGHRAVPPPARNTNIRITHQLLAECVEAVSERETSASRLALGIILSRELTDVQLYGWWLVDKCSCALLSIVIDVEV